MSCFGCGKKYGLFTKEVFINCNKINVNFRALTFFFLYYIDYSTAVPVVATPTALNV